MRYTSAEVITSNIALHTQLAPVYQHTEPHYRPENVARIKAILASLQAQTEGTTLLDIGCGMGFMIDLAQEYFKIIRGIDITPAMLAQVNTQNTVCDIQVQLAQSEAIPFADQTFDVVTAHAVLHHLYDLQPTLQEVYRVLKPGGMLYSDLDPNAYFWEAITALSPAQTYHDLIRREMNALAHPDQGYGVDQNLLALAEPLKHLKGGLQAEEVTALLETIGFSQIAIQYEWFLGEARIIHDSQTAPAAQIIRDHLHDLLPLSRHLFKYLSIRARK